MKHWRLSALVAAAALLALITSQGSAVAGKKEKAQNSLFASLSGYDENPTLSSPGFGEFSGRVSDDDTRIDYTLSFGGMETRVSQAHIHLGRPWVNGGIFVFLCGGGPRPAPPCPPEGGTVEGFFEASDITGGAGAQGIQAGELDKALAAIRAGATYVNVHTMARPPGEVRGQVVAFSEK